MSYCIYGILENIFFFFYKEKEHITREKNVMVRIGLNHTQISREVQPCLESEK